MHIPIWININSILHDIDNSVTQIRNVEVKSYFQQIKWLLIYKAILKPAWSYGIELWRCASPSNIAKIQRYQSKLLRLITNAPWFVTNQTLHQDLCIEEVRYVFRETAAAHYKTLTEHPNPLMGPLTDRPKQRRLKCSWTFDGIN
jgi:hypothetical protein